MKRRLFGSLFTGLLLMGVILFMTSCSDSNDDIIETAWNVENISVNASDWTWNPAEERWEAGKQLDFIDEFIYESGAVLGYIFITENNREVQYQLPYTLNIVEGEAVFTETIDYNFDFKTSRITFLIKPSDSFQDENAKLTYNFRIVMIW